MLRKTSVAAVVLALSTGAAGLAVAAEPDSYCPTKGDGRIDVVRYALDLKWKPGDKTLVGTATLKVEAEEAADSMTLDLHGAMKVRQVTVNGISVDPIHDGNDLLLPQLMVPQSRYDVVVKYAGKPRSWSTPSPRAAAASPSALEPSRSAWEMKAVLQELASAVRSGIRPIAPDG